jgi:hypothetical protein
VPARFWAEAQADGKGFPGFDGFGLGDKVDGQLGILEKRGSRQGAGTDQSQKPQKQER